MPELRRNIWRAAMKFYICNMCVIQLFDYAMCILAPCALNREIRRTTMKRNLRNVLLATLLATVTPLLSAPAMAQGMPMMSMGQGIEKLAAKLKLTPEQRKEWDSMVQKSKAQHESMRLSLIHI